MIEIKLENNLLNTWKTKNGIHVKGKAFSQNELLNSDALLGYFENINNDSIVEKLNNLSGHFSAVIETDSNIYFAVDTIRTYGLFFILQENKIVLTDQITEFTSWNETETENFKKIYCTLENATLLNGWKQLQAGEYAVIDKKNLSIEIKTYYQHCKSETEDKNDLKTLEKQLVNKIKLYANNRKVLIPLSGGYDSRYLLSLLAENNYTNVECFTYGRKDSYEVLIAKNVCEKLKVKWHFIEYSDDLLQSFFSKEWEQYSEINHHFSSLPHEQDFFALFYLRKNGLLAENAIIMNGFCQDLHAGSIFEPVHNFDLQKFIYHKYHIKPELEKYENSWNGYQQWFIKNRVSKFIINSVQVYEYFGLDFYLPFWNTSWINFWYSQELKSRLNQQYYNEYLFNGIFARHHITFKKPTHDTTNKYYTLKKISKAILPSRLTKLLQANNRKDISKDANNTLFLYEEIYKQLKNKPEEKDFKINNIHAIYLLEKLKENYQL